MQRFLDRRDAGRQLARKLLKYANRTDVIVLALPRGGVPVGYEIAAAINAPLDVWIVRKLGLPGQEELAIGAIASGGIRTLNEDIIHALAVSQVVIDQVTERETLELQRREQQYRAGRPAPEIRDRTAILVDDESTDATAAIASRLAGQHGGTRLRIVSGRELPSGWTGSTPRWVDRSWPRAW